ncbi:MAG: F0F1 ATP synthase subunit A [Peptococcaceae bacterium]|nr:F0F1 ATP synthase subunit A [Peptococcaceae bacterium]
MGMIEKVHHNLNIWHIPQEPWHLGSIGGFPIDLNPSTIIFTWVAMGLVLLLGFFFVRGANVRQPTKMQTMFEMVLDFLRGLVDDNMDKKKGDEIFSLVITFFLFITMCNIVGLVPSMMAPTADVQTTAAFAVITFVMMFYMGIKHKGGKYFAHYLKPYPFFLPITILEDLAKPVTLAFRLFGNMKGKEIMIYALLALITGIPWACGGFTASVVWLGFGLFVSFIQAFIFTMLTIAYIGMACADDH